MANIVVTFKGLTGILGTVTVDDALTLGALIEAIATEEGLNTDYYAISVENNPAVNDTTYDDSTVTIGGTLPTGAGITADTRIICTPRQQGTKERRQIQKLDIAQRKRTGGPADDSSVDYPYYRILNEYDRDSLPTKYSGNTVIDNANSGGLLPGRPWTGVVTAPPAPAFVNPTLTIGSAVTTVSQSPFAGGGNSYSFIQSTDSYIDIAASSDWALGTDDFTIEWFGLQTAFNQFERVFTVDDFPSIDVGVSIEGATFYYWADGLFRYIKGASTTTNTWYHWAVVRQSNITKVYRNGLIWGTQITDNNNINNTVDPLTIGASNAHGTEASWVGYITNFRWIKGLAVYTGSFTVPTSALTATASANPYGGSNTQAIPSGVTKLLLVP